jgi:putative chitinase
MIYDEADLAKVLTLDEFSRIFPECPDATAWHRAFDDAMAEHDMGRPDAAMLLAQVGHESMGLTRLKESLWYSASRLCAVWPSRFPTLESAAPYAGNPEALANKVYGGRMGNTNPGDGWRYHGRGCIQLTGRSNYQAFELDTGFPALRFPERLMEPMMGAASAVWYFTDRVTGSWSDVENVTRKINGGLHGLEDRRERYHKAMAILADS